MKRRGKQDEAPILDKHHCEERVECLGDDDDKVTPTDDPLKHCQLESIAALAKQDDESEGKIHGGAPISALATNAGTYSVISSNTSDDNAPPKMKTSCSGDVLHQEPPSNCTFGNAMTQDRNGVYSEDLVGANPTFRISMSPMHDKVGVINEDVSSDLKPGICGHASEDDSNSVSQKEKPLVLESTGLGVGRCLGAAQVPIEADELVYRHGEGCSLTDLPGSLDGIVYKPNAVAQSQGTGQCLGNTLKAFTTEGNS